MWRTSWPRLKMYRLKKWPKSPPLMPKKFSNASRDIVFLQPFKIGRLVRVVEGARLESVYTGNRIEGSNPSVSAKIKKAFKSLDLKAFFVRSLCQLFDKLCVI